MRILFILFLSTLFIGCKSSDEHVLEIESIRGKVESDITAGNSNSKEDITWNFFEATTGEYNQQIIIELATSETEVSGRYFYTKHQRFLTLIGTYDTLTQQYSLTESYKGEPTGYLDFQLTEDRCIQGNWRKEQDTSSMPISFIGKELDLYLNNRDQMDVRFSEYEREHNALTYVLSGNDPIEEEALDQFKLSTIDQKHFAFYFQSASDNAHYGTLQGIATMVEEDYAIFNANNDDCLVSFRFYEDSVVIEEENDCSDYFLTNARYKAALIKKEE